LAWFVARLKVTVIVSPAAYAVAFAPLAATKLKMVGAAKRNTRKKKRKRKGKGKAQKENNRGQEKQEPSHRIAQSIRENPKIRKKRDILRQPAQLDDLLSHWSEVVLSLMRNTSLLA
jgi:hypothetical protein